MSLRIACADGRERERAVAAGHAAARRGDLALVPTEAVYAVATDAFSRRGIAALRDAKGTDAGVPLPVMVGRRATVAGIATGVSQDAQRLMDVFWPGPLTLLMTPQPSLAWDVAVDSPVAVRMPLHPVALALLARTGPMAMTSANLPGMPAPSDVDDALEQLGDAVTVALDAGPLLSDGAGAPSTIVDVTGTVPVVVRIGAVSADDLRRVCPDVRTGLGNADA